VREPSYFHLDNIFFGGLTTGKNFFWAIELFFSWFFSFSVFFDLSSIKTISYTITNQEEETVEETF